MTAWLLEDDITKRRLCQPMRVMPTRFQGTEDLIAKEDGEDRG